MSMIETQDRTESPPEFSTDYWLAQMRRVLPSEVTDCHIRIDFKVHPKDGYQKWTYVAWITGNGSFENFMQSTPENPDDPAHRDTIVRLSAQVHDWLSLQKRRASE